jgi:two-component system CheB/CheR fusion protein
MLNLLSNAVKFTDKGGSINVNMYDRQDRIQICVKDTGAGIPDGKLDIIFDRFRQVDKSLTRAHEGSGIGLSLVKSFVELHKGNISVSSKYGEGSEFIITLPVSTVPDDTENCDGSEAAALKSNVERINLEFSDVYGSWLS